LAILPMRILKALPDSYTILEDGCKLTFSRVFKSMDELYTSFLLDNFQCERAKPYFDRGQYIHAVVVCAKSRDKLRLSKLSFQYGESVRPIGLSKSSMDGYYYTGLPNKMKFQMIYDAGWLLDDHFEFRYDWEKYFKEISSFPFDKNIAHFFEEDLTFTPASFVELSCFDDREYSGFVFRTYKTRDEYAKWISLHLTYCGGEMKYTVYGLSVESRYDTLHEAYEVLKTEIKKHRIRDLFGAR